MYIGTYTYGVSLIRRNEEFFHYDGIGSARTFTNASGVVTAAAMYGGFGNTVATSGSTGSPYQFGATFGYRCDGDAGIMQVGAKYYDPSTGSFLTRDADLGQLAYVYCWGDPIDRLDPSGHRPPDWFDASAWTVMIAGLKDGSPIVKVLSAVGLLFFEIGNHPEWFSHSYYPPSR